MNALQFMIQRINGKSIETDMPWLINLVKSGVAGFIVFGGELMTLRRCIGELQAHARYPLIISSDLEQGLGQQVSGGTVFPPACAYKGSMHKTGLIRSAFNQIAQEALYAGINVIYAPVLDTDTNPLNPIISTRAFAKDARTVMEISTEMINAFMACGIKSCGKHFPGHGDTETDSHISLPVINKPLSGLESYELMPFQSAIDAGIDMIMLGHLSVPAIDNTGIPMSASVKAVDYLKNVMGFNGIIITDALNMGGLSGLTEADASIRALNCGVDYLLHPTDIGRLSSEISKHISHINPGRALSFRESLAVKQDMPAPKFDSSISVEITNNSIEVEGNLRRNLTNPYVLILDDDKGMEGNYFIDSLKKFIRLEGSKVITSEEDAHDLQLNDKCLIVAVFSSLKAWKGGTARFIDKTLNKNLHRVAVALSFSGRHVLRAAESDPDILRIYGWWGSEQAQDAVVKRLSLLL